MDHVTPADSRLSRAGLFLVSHGSRHTCLNEATLAGVAINAHPCGATGRTRTAGRGKWDVDRGGDLSDGGIVQDGTLANALWSVSRPVSMAVFGDLPPRWSRRLG